ncbi:hypothetical protein CDAR_58511 [Caerostris darwini]|uniref:Uncharacterized protein n=1 Tax=Caerostris darwini TaxID=1538125 RepID=A0AAV4U786_9ARAC|nr:hypothetical protein CDAR_58511 [Caerostris darwini]
MRNSETVFPCRLHKRMQMCGERGRPSANLSSEPTTLTLGGSRPTRKTRALVDGWQALSHGPKPEPARQGLQGGQVLGDQVIDN